MIGPSVAQRLGADYVDRLILTDAARRVGATVEAMQQREERPPTRGERLLGTIQRVLERSAVTTAGSDPYFGPGAVDLLTTEFEDLPQPTITSAHELEDEKYIEAMSSVIRELASAGNVVIVGRGAPFLLRNDPSVLRVAAVATMADRVSRIVEVEGLGPDKAAETLTARDAARAYHYKRYFGIDAPDAPELYHLVINTSDVDPESAVEIIVQASQALSGRRLEPQAQAT